ncbi:hypothetical protein N0V83_009902 [Neocucurbitaria cava]|uniref:Uncharacterized protein n=1 Tax=Neocucurbitaria cava TaxID=798079 RepID=A0A9W8Y1R9_9PLEO|nr:hypothetical protein N0V83_009902 [Neocucurbitaria cava]
MCNVIAFRFTCAHTLYRRRSSCSGTKHKVTRTSVKAACTAESFLTLTLPYDCGPCQRYHWESNWKSKLSRANSFLHKLEERRSLLLPAESEEVIRGLVKQLEDQYTSEAWGTRNVFAEEHKRSVARVRVGEYRRIQSLLSREVRAEDVVEEGEGKEWALMGVSDYDGDYEASTDPIHPVSTDYRHPWDDGDDGKWVLEQLGEGEEVESSDEVDTIDFAKSCWSWGDDDGFAEAMEKATPTSSNEQEKKQDREDRAVDLPNAIQEGTWGDESLIAWGPEAEASSSTSTAYINMNGHGNTHTDDAIRKAQVEEVIAAFWRAVNPAPTMDNSNTAKKPQPPPLPPQEGGQSAVA